MNKMTVFKSMLWTFVGLAFAAGITRMIFGLGSISNLSDSTPWGFWKGVNVIPGIALSAGGFVVTAIIYIMNREEYKRYAKVTVLLALLGYITAATALVVELGLPWMVWKPVIYWQHHSALFEVAWCVILYLTVMILEFLPVPLEETSRFAWIRKFLNKYKIVLVFLGIMISSLHQSSLGTLFLIVPSKLHALWYTPLLPLLFLISAVAVGPLVLILAVLTISWLYGKPVDKNILAKLGFWAVVVIGLYGLIRIVDLGARGMFPIIFNGSWQSAVFLIEILLSVLVPVILLGSRRMRYSQRALWIACTAASVGVVLNRANVAGIMLNTPGPVYVPTIYEIFISIGIVAAAALVFFFCIEHFKVWEDKWEDNREKPEVHPEFDRSSEVWLGRPRVASRTVFSMIFILSLSIGFAIIPNKNIRSEGIMNVVAKKARGGNTLFVDGNHDGFGVVFPHNDHIEKNVKNKSCARCHHMNLPKDEQSGCYACHLNMYQQSDAFRHDWHADPGGGNVACIGCHREGVARTDETTKECKECHEKLYPQDAHVKVKQYMAPAYTSAMHGLCVECHREKAAELKDKKNLGLCSACHKTTMPAGLEQEMKKRFEERHFNHVELPQISLQREVGKENHGQEDSHN